jgi:hypothetical protein
MTRPGVPGGDASPSMEAPTPAPTEEETEVGPERPHERNASNWPQLLWIGLGVALIVPSSRSTSPVSSARLRIELASGPERGNREEGSIDGTT